MYSVECEVCLQWKWILRIIPIGCEYLRLIVNIFSWMWGLSTAEVDFTNNSDWMWIFAIDCEYFHLNVMFVYSGTGFCEYFRLDVDICDRLWIFTVECDVCVHWKWILRMFPIGCEYLRSIVNIFSWMWCVCTVELNFTNNSDSTWIFAIEFDWCVQRIGNSLIIQLTHSVYIVMCLLLIAMLFSLCDWNCGNYCELLFEVCVGAHLNFVVRCIFPTHPSVAWSWWRGIEILWGNVCLGTWIRFGTELRSWKRVTQFRLCDENTPFTKSFRMSSVSSGAVGLPWISVRMFVIVDFFRKIDPRSVPFLPRLCLLWRLLVM